VDRDVDAADREETERAAERPAPSGSTARGGRRRRRRRGQRSWFGGMISELPESS